MIADISSFLKIIKSLLQIKNTLNIKKIMWFLYKEK